MSYIYISCNNMKLIYFEVYCTYLYVSCFWCRTFDISSPELYKNEICSFKGIPVIQKDNSIKCECFDGYETFNPKGLSIKNINIQCNYAKKKRFIALFFSIFIPLGIDYLYLEQYFLFITTLLLIIIIIGGNCFLILQSELHKSQNDASSQKPLLPLSTNHKKLKLIFLCLCCLLLIAYFINIYLIISGKIKDGNGIDTMNDISFLFNIF